MGPFRFRLALLIAAAGSSAASAGPDAVYGTWGTEAQCARAPLIAGGTRRAAPVVISEAWLQHGEIWCRLDWFDTEMGGAGTSYFAARALCGEDAARDYGLGVHLDGPALTLIWNQEQIAGPLRRCAGSR